MRTQNTNRVYSAACRDCAWVSVAVNAQGTAALHHDHTGHVVEVGVNQWTVYGDPDKPIPGQTSLLAPYDPQA